MSRFTCDTFPAFKIGDILTIETVVKRWPSVIV
jgi:hypothetical protein